MVPAGAIFFFYMEDIEDRLKRVIPTLDDASLASILQKLQSLGVETIDDLQLLQEDDLQGLKPVQTRTFLSHKPGSSQTREQASSSSSCPTSPEPYARPFTFTNHNQNPNWPTTLHLPWDDIPDITYLLNQGKRLPQQLRYRLVRSVCDKVRTVACHATKRQWSIIAQRMVSKYPQSLQDKIDDLIIGTGHDSLESQLVSRNENLNRSKDTSLGLKRQMSTDSITSGSRLDKVVM